MTQEKYFTLLKELEEEHSKNKAAIMQSYAEFHNPYEIGDYVKDHVGWMRIDEMRVFSGGMSSKLPSMVYAGIAVKVDLSPKKSGEKVMCYQINVIDYKCKTQ